MKFSVFTHKFIAAGIMLASATLMQAQSVWFFGQNPKGLGNGSYAINANPTITSPVMPGAALSVGEFVNLVITNDQTIWSWGNNNTGQLGIGSFAQSNGSSPGFATPVHVVNMTQAVGIAVGGYSSMALKSNGTVWTWGDNEYGELGNGSYIVGSPYGTNNPTQVVGLSKMVQVSCGEKYDLALKSDGSVWGWGHNSEGELGLGYFSPNFSGSNGVTTPTKVNSVSNVIAISAGRYHTLVLMKNGTVWAWGDNQYGELGNNSFTGSGGSQGYGIALPAQVLGLSNVKAIAAGNYYSLAIKNDGTVWIWGDIGDGHLGNGLFGNGGPGGTGVSVPAQIPGLTNVAAVSCGFLHCMALKNDGTVWAWGNSAYGQYVNSSGGYGLVQLAGLSGVTMIASGTDHNLAIESSSAVSFTAKIKTTGWQGAPIINVLVSIDGLAAQSVTLVGNQFSLTLTPGPHTINVRTAGFLAQKLAVLATSGAPVVNFYGPNGAGFTLGDTNGDGVVDDQDLLNVINHFLTNSALGDTNGDGIVDDSDLLNVINNFLAVSDV